MGFPLLTVTGDSKKPAWLRAVEPVATFALIMLYIWRLRASAPASWVPMFGLLLLSHYYHGEEAETLGFRRTNFTRCAEAFAPTLLFLALALLSTGILLQTTRPICFDQGLMGFAGYCLWGLFQQYVLNGYFVNRFHDAAPARYVPALAGALFATVHLPNWFLMAISFVAGYLCAQIYLKYRNLYFLGIAHGAIGFLLFLVVPDTISRHLTVGPAWFSH